MSDLRFDCVRPEPPLTDDDYASIRRAVMDEVRTRRPQPVIGWLRPAVAAVVVAAFLALGLFLMRPAPSAPVAQQPSIPGAVRKHAPMVVTTATSSSPGSVPGVTTEGPPLRDRTAPRVAHNRKRSLPAPEALVATAPQEPVVMQFQTSNPDIRIIWITR